MPKSRVEVIIGERYIIINDLDTGGKIIDKIVSKTPLHMEKQFSSPCG